VSATDVYRLLTPFHSEQNKLHFTHRLTLNDSAASPLTAQVLILLIPMIRGSGGSGMPRS
jgi:hypothetical protein